MSFEHLLRDVPSIEEWAAPHLDRGDLTSADIAGLVHRYSEEFAVRLPAFDDEGWPTTPPDDHIIDACARAWLPTGDNASALRADFGTVEVIAERVRCEICNWGAARYASRVGSGCDYVALCLGCLVHQGDPVLGSDRSVMMLTPDEVPYRVLDQLMPHIDQDGRPLWASSRNDGWDAYRRWGFTGPDETGRVYATILDVQLSVRLGPLDSVEIEIRRAGIRNFYRPHGQTQYAPRSQDPLDVRAILMRILRGEARTGRQLEDRDRYFAVRPTERDERAVAALERRGGPRWLRLGQEPFGESGDHQMSVAAAKESENPLVLARLARAHPDGYIRHAAIANPALEPHILAEAAAARDEAVTGALLAREDLPREATAHVVETLLLAGRLDHYQLLPALERPDFPDRLLETVVERISAGGTGARILLAEAIHNAPAHRRDLVHLQLLRGARKIQSTLDLIDAVIGKDADRALWLTGQEDWKIRALMDWRDQQREKGAQADSPPSSPTPSSATVAPARRAEPATAPEPPAGPAVALVQKPTPAATSARLRRWWLSEAMTDAGLVASDLGDALDQCRLVRVGSELRVHMPYDFGTGSPVSPDVDRRLTARVAELSGGAIGRISWTFTDAAKPTTRGRSSDLDVYEPGDPLVDAWSSAAADLADRIGRHADERALTALGDLRLAGVSRHRVWLALSTTEDVRGIGTTPGAAATLKIATAKFQGRRKPDEALYAVVADPDPSVLRLPLP